jgi:hypothetical protein
MRTEYAPLSVSLWGHDQRHSAVINSLICVSIQVEVRFSQGPACRPLLSRSGPQPRRSGWVPDITWSGSLFGQQYASAPVDPSTAAAWRDLYIGTVGAGASLTGLTLVAIALDPHQIERTPLLRLRAASALWCFVSVMFIGLAVLTPCPFSSVASLAVGVGGNSSRRCPARLSQPATNRNAFSRNSRSALLLARAMAAR